MNVNEQRPIGPKWKGSKFEMRCGLFGLSCHVGIVLVINMISSMVVLATQGIFIYKKSSTFALGGFTGPFLDIFLVFICVTMWCCNLSITLVRMQFAFAILTAICSGALFVIDCALVAVFILLDESQFAILVLLCEIAGAFGLFCTTIPFLVGGNWLLSVKQAEEEKRKLKTTDSWIVRNRVQPGLQILDIDEIAAQNTASTGIYSISANDSFRFSPTNGPILRPVHLGECPPNYSDIFPKSFPWGERRYEDSIVAEKADDFTLVKTSIGYHV
ncbi:Oidioi.mRNA.OKI2018_I69.chr1.g817.t1.cds [Oikopleura dioica]|uniref:Oidioi.mRNA.OKI2018_I69.chr1.g817.t1.cds n=1 Tax=Oikopleura dioica TaxID=34765 RepID=A0ABN7SLK5_OIKDI|nr:Oidioi.mRNA.OKI2018_I69.chr1.g817.t1.cds [Oikopleura dioica]